MITKIIYFLNINNGAIQSITTIVLVITTIYYALQTKKTVKEMQESRKYDFLPILEIEMYQNSPSFLNIKISNIGKGLARSPVVFIPSRESEIIKNLGSRETFEYNYNINMDEILKLKNDDLKLKIEYLDVFSRKIISDAILTYNTKNNHLIMNNWNLILPNV